jgi:hypothetical protein
MPWGNRRLARVRCSHREGTRFERVARGERRARIYGDTDDAISMVEIRGRISRGSRNWKLPQRASAKAHGASQNDLLRYFSMKNLPQDGQSPPRLKCFRLLRRLRPGQRNFPPG